MRYKIYHPNIDQDIHPRPLTLFAESDNFAELLKKAEKTGSEAWVSNWIFFYDTKFNLHLEPYRTKHGIKFRSKKVNPKHEHHYNPDKFTESELTRRLREDEKTCREYGEK